MRSWETRRKICPCRNVFVALTKICIPMYIYTVTAGDCQTVSTRIARLRGEAGGARQTDSRDQETETETRKKLIPERRGFQLPQTAPACIAPRPLARRTGASRNRPATCFEPCPR